MHSPPTRYSTRVLTLLALLLALLAPALFAAPDAAANETDPGNWVIASQSDSLTSGVPGVPAPDEISGVTINDEGRIYAIDNRARQIYCLANEGTTADPEWESYPVSGSNLPTRDTEGIAWLGGDSFVVSWEDQTGSNFSGLTEFTIVGLTASNSQDTSLAPIQESSTSHAGGAEGVAATGIPGRYYIVQEGLVGPNGPEPTLYVFDNGTLSLPITLNGGVDSAGVAVEPGVADAVWVVSDPDRTVRKFHTAGPQAGDQIGSAIQLPYSDPEGIAFTADGVHMIVVGESQDIVILQQAGSQAPLPTGNCGPGPVVPCPSADMTISPNPAMLGDTVTVEVTVLPCDPNVDITRTRIQAWNTDIDWSDSLVDVPGELQSYTFTGTTNASGVSEMAVNVSIWFTAWNDDGTLTVPGEATLPLRETFTTEDPAVGGQLVEIQNVRTGRYLDVDGTKVTTDRNGGSLWNVIDRGDGTVYIVNANDGTYLDIDAGWVTEVEAQAVPDFGSAWILRTYKDGSVYITNADFTAAAGYARANIRSTTNRTANNPVTVTSWNSSFTRWFVAPVN